jgi:outer membrane protein assembly factor BamB
MDRAVRNLDPDPKTTLRSILRRGGLRRTARWGAIGVVVAVFLAGLGWAGLEIRRQQAATPADTSDWRTYRDPELGWSVAYPPGWRLQAFDQEIGLLAAFRGVLVSNVDFRFHHPDLGDDAHTTAWDMRGIPAHAVVVEFHFQSRFGGPNEKPQMPFPLSLEDAQPSRDRPAYGAPQPRLFLPVRGTSYAVNAWFGPDASEQDREIARRMVASIRTTGAEVSEEPECIGQVASPTPTESPDVLWRFRLEEWNVTAPVLVGDTVYVGSNGPFAGDGCLFALDAATGTVRWSRPPGIDAYTVPVPVGDSLVVAVGGALYGLDRDTGEERWSVQVGNVDREVFINGGIVFVAGPGGLTAVDARTGRVVWELAGLEGPAVWPIVNDDGTVYVSSLRDRYPLRLHALDASTGKPRWTAPALGVSVAAGQGMVVVEQAPNTLHGHDSSTGGERWRLNVPGGASTRPVVIGDLAVLAADSGTALGIDLETGQIRWQTAVGTFGTPVVVGDRLAFVGTTEGVRAIDPGDGSVTWSLESGSGVESLALQGNTLIAGAGGEVYGLDPSTGSTLWQVQAGRRVNRTPTSAGNTVFVRDGTQDVVAVRVPQ